MAEFDPNLKRATAAGLHKKGQKQLERGDVSEASRLFLEAHRLDRVVPAYLLAAAATLCQLGQMPAAVRHYETVLRMHISPKEREEAERGLAAAHCLSVGSAPPRPGRLASARPSTASSRPSSASRPPTPRAKAACPRAVRPPRAPQGWPPPEPHYAPPCHEDPAREAALHNVAAAADRAFRAAPRRPLSARPGTAPSGRQPGMKFSAGGHANADGSMLKANARPNRQQALAAVDAAANRARDRSLTRDQQEAAAWHARNVGKEAAGRRGVGGGAGAASADAARRCPRCHLALPRNARACSGCNMALGGGNAGPAAAECKYQVQWRTTPSGSPYKHAFRANRALPSALAS